MKKNIENKEDLLKQLALQGDPYAFFLLSEPYFITRYRKERFNGAAHQDAQTRIIDDAIEMLEELQHVTPAKFDAWFEGRCTIATGAQAGPKPEAASDKKIAAETDAFLKRCSRELLRTSSVLKKARRLRERSLSFIMFRSKIAVCLWIFAATFALLFTGVMLMTKTATAVVVSIDTPRGRFSVRFPPPTMYNHEKKQLAVPVATPTTLDTYGTAPPDSMRQKNVSYANQLPHENKKAGPRPAAGKRSLPPVVPKARLILPPMPPPSPVSETMQPIAPEIDKPLTAPLPQEPPQPSYQSVPAETDPFR